MDSDLEVQILFPTASHSAAPTRVADHYLMKPAEPHDLQKGGMRFWGHQSTSLSPSGLCPESVTEGSPDGLCSLWMKSSNRTHLNFRLFLPITPLQVLLSLPTWALKSPSRKMDSLHVAPLSTLHHWLQEGWVFWPVTWQIIADNSQDLFPKLKAQGNTPLTHWQKLQCTEQIKDCPPCSLPLTEGNSRLEQRRSPLQDTGSRAQASSGSSPFREVIFHVPKATLDSRKSVCQGRFFGLHLGTSRSLWMGPW